MVRKSTKKKSSKPTRTTRKATRKRSTRTTAIKFVKRGRGRIRKARRTTVRPPPTRRKSLLKKDARPPTTKSTSAKPTANSVYVSPANEQQVMKTLRKPMSIAKQDKDRVAKVKSLFSKTKDNAKKIGRGIEKTAKFVGKVAEAIEPFLDAAAARNPENPLLLGAAGVDTFIADTKRLIDHTAHNASKGHDAYSQRTETGKLRKIMGIGGAPSIPQITMMDPIPEAHYPPLPKIAPSAYGVVEEID